MKNKPYTDMPRKPTGLMTRSHAAAKKRKAKNKPAEAPSNQTMYPLGSNPVPEGPESAMFQTIRTGRKK